MKKESQIIADNNAGRAMQAIETLFNGDIELLKMRVSKLIYYTAEDVEKYILGEVRNGNRHDPTV